MIYTCAIIDDEPFALEQLEEYLAVMPNFKLIKAYSNPVLALTEINLLQKPIDFLFTDVEMPLLNGLELVKKIHQKPNYTILVSAHQKYALDGYGVNANAFLSKPYNLIKLKTVITTVLSQANEKPFIWIRCKGNHKIYLDSIITIEGASNYVKITTVDGNYMPYLKLKDIEKDLSYCNFIKRASKSFIVSANYIDKIVDKNIYLKNKVVVKLGSDYGRNFKYSSD